MRGNKEQVALPPRVEFHRVRRRYAKAMLGGAMEEESGQVSDRRGGAVAAAAAARSESKQEKSRSS